MDADNLYDEFGNYIGPELDDGDDGQDVGYAAQVRVPPWRARTVVRTSPAAHAQRCSHTTSPRHLLPPRPACSTLTTPMAPLPTARTRRRTTAGSARTRRRRTR